MIIGFTRWWRRRRIGSDATFRDGEEGARPCSTDSRLTDSWAGWKANKHFGNVSAAWTDYLLRQPGGETPTNQMSHSRDKVFREKSFTPIIYGTHKHGREWLIDAFSAFSVMRTYWWSIRVKVISDCAPPLTDSPSRNGTLTVGL